MQEESSVFKGHCIVTNDGNASFCITPMSVDLSVNLLNSPFNILCSLSSYVFSRKLCSVILGFIKFEDTIRKI